MIERLQIARNWLPRYMDMSLDKFGDYILLTNFRYYIRTLWAWPDSMFVP
jgi:AMP nucleosidase